MKKKCTHPRAICAIILTELFENQQPFIPYQAPAYALAQSQQDKAFITELCFQTLRAYPKLSLISEQLLDKPFREQDRDIFCLLLIGLGELERDQKSHAAIYEAVEGCVHLNKPWAKKVLNACLRTYQREKEQIATQFKDNLVYQTQHPSWIIQTFKKAWPNAFEKILLANNEHPPMTVWVNPQKTTPQEYRQLLAAAAIDTDDTDSSQISNLNLGLTLLKPLPQQSLPHYDLGWVNVQNASAQIAAELLNVNDTNAPLSILDACAAPGNKTATLIAKITHPKSHVLALDVHKKRLESARVLLTRLGLNTSSQVSLKAANAGNPDAWWDGQRFDRILLDAPCSGTGVIRRHPDIKCHLTLKRLTEVKAQQAKLLKALWPLLQPGGLFLYSTCSVLPEENEDQIAGLLTQFKDIRVEAINIKSLEFIQSLPTLKYGLQILPEGVWDGFYYCLMSKKT